MTDGPSPNPLPSPDNRLERSLSFARLNLLSIPVGAGATVVGFLPFLLLWGVGPLASGLREFLRPFSIVPAFLLGLVVHEALHGFGWMVAGRKPFRAIRFGFKISALTPFAHCTEPITARAYRIGALLPSLFLGAGPTVAACATASGWTLCFGVLFLIAASGDFLVLWAIRDIPAEWMVEDHPHRVGCIVYEANNPPTVDR